MQRSNNWSNINNTRDEVSQSDISHKEFDIFEQWNDGTYFPQMNPLKVLGAIHDESHQKEYVYAIETVT